MSSYGRDPMAGLQELSESLRDRSGASDWFYTAPRSEWALRLGVLVDGKPLEFETHKYLPAIYDDMSQVVVVIKAAQMGLSIWAMIKMLHRGLTLQPYNTGYYLPTQDKTNEFSQVRFDTLCDSIPRVAEIRNTSPIWRVGVKQLYSSNFYFSYTEGRVSTESTPLDGLEFDEVRRMNATKIDLIKERTSHSRYDHNDFISTAGYPGSDIHFWYLQSDEQEWWVRCHECLHHFLPHADFPKHIERRQILGNPMWGIVCPKCDAFNVDAQGEGSVWIPSFTEGRRYRGYHVTQLMSKWVTLDRIMHHFYTTEDVAEFWRSKLGVPYLDPETILVQPKDLNRCVDTTLVWGKTLPVMGNGIRQGMEHKITVMGIDQQAGYNIYTVKELFADRPPATLHLEYGYGVRPFDRAAELMREYDINCCVSDRAPNFNDAEDFAQMFEGRVWLATYTGVGGGEKCIWHDQTKKGELPTYVDERAPHHVSINRVVALEWSLLRFRQGQNRIPHPDGLVQEVRPRDLIDPMMGANIVGRTVEVPICRKIYFEHLQRLAKVRDPIVNEAGVEVVAEARFRFDNIGCDPHFAHSNLYCDIAMLRVQKLASGYRTAAQQWYSKTEDEKLAESEALFKGQLVEAAPGVLVAPYDYAQVTPDKAWCKQCGQLFWFDDTRAVQAADGSTQRACLNCLTPHKTKDVCKPIPQGKENKRFTKRMKQYEEAVRLAGIASQGDGEDERSSGPDADYEPTT